MNEELIIILVLPLVSSSLIGLIARRLGLSTIAGYIIGGIIVGPVFHLVDPTSPILNFLSELGVILIAFEIGLVVKIDFLNKGGLKSGGIVFVEILIVSLVSLFLGTVFNLSLGDTLVLMFIAANTSTAVTFKMMEERGFDDPNVRIIILGVGAFEDIVAIVGLSIFPVLAAIGSLNPFSLIQMLAGILVSVILMVYLGLRLLGRPLEWAAGKESEIFLALSLGVVLTYAYFGLLSGLSTAFGAFIAGLVVSNLGVSETISEKFHPIRDLSTLIFFSSIGASLPVVKDPIIIIVSIVVALFVVLLKYVGFSISSWAMGMRLENSLRLGLYMLAISEFGVILAKNAADEGLASEALYLVSVVALASSAILSSGLIMLENTLPERLASMVPLVMRLRLESLFTILGRALGKESEVLTEIREAFWDLMKRIAIIFLVVGLGNFVLNYLTPIIEQSSLRLFVEVTVTVFTLTLIILIGLRTRSIYQKLIKSIVSRIDQPQLGLLNILESLLYAITLAIVAIVILLVSYPLISRYLDYLIGEIGSSLLVTAIIIAILLLAWRSALRACLRLEDTFQIR